MTVKPSFTKLLLGIKTTCLILSLIAFVAYRVVMRKFKDIEIPIDQRVISILSITLILFNDPLYLCNIFVPNFALSIFSGIFVCTFLTFILFYWLYSFQRVPEVQDYKTETFTIGKAVFFGVLTDI